MAEVSLPDWLRPAAEPPGGDSFRRGLDTDGQRWLRHRSPRYPYWWSDTSEATIRCNCGSQQFHHDVEAGRATCIGCGHVHEAREEF